MNKFIFFLFLALLLTSLVTKTARAQSGQVKFSLKPSSGSFSLNQSIPIEVFIDTQNLKVGAFAIRLNYPYSNEIPEVEASNLTIDQNLLVSGGWVCPVKKIEKLGGNINIDLACANTTPAGFSSSLATRVAKFEIKAYKTPPLNPLSISFDPAQTIAVKKDDGISAESSLTNSSLKFPGDVNASPPPKTNHPPKITTFFLFPAIVNKTYKATIRGEDSDLKDDLKMSIQKNLPPDLKDEGCGKTRDQTANKIKCKIKGEVKKPGLYNITVSLKDDKGGMESRTFWLLVIPIPFI